MDNVYGIIGDSVQVRIPRILNWLPRNKLGSRRLARRNTRDRQLVTTNVVSGRVGGKDYRSEG